MVRTARIDRTAVLVGKLDPSLVPSASRFPSALFSVSFGLTPQAIQTLRPIFSEKVGATILAICNDRVISPVVLLSALGSEVGALGNFRTAKAARMLATALTDRIDESPVATPMITSVSVGSLKLGDSLLEISRKLKECGATLMHARIGERDLAFLHTRCGGTWLNLELADDGRVQRIEVIGGLAKTPAGFEVGSDIAQVIGRYGLATVHSQGARICLTFADVAGIGFCLGDEDSARFRQLVGSKVRVGQVEGPIEAILVYGTSAGPYDK